MLPVYGHATARAPHLSRLAEEGVTMENAYCNFPLCAPSRASMHAGMLPHRMECFDNAGEFHADIPTLPHYLRLRGYSATLCGKMHFVGPDQLHGYERRLTTEIYPSNFAWTVDWSRGREYRPTELTMAPVIESGPCVRTMQMDYDDEVAHCGVQEIYNLARYADGKPFFLTASFTHPHSPFVIGEEFWNLYADDEIAMPSAPDIPPDERDLLSRNLYYCHARHRFTVTEEHIRRARRAYCGMISYLDFNVGRLLAALKAVGLDDNTIVMFVADHGEMLGERGMWYKQHFFEGAARVPMIVRWPGVCAPGRIDGVVSLADVMPTLLEAAGGADFACAPDGSSMLGLLSGGKKEWKDEAISEYSGDGSTGPSRMVRRGDWKYMDIEGEDELLFNVRADPLEQNNLAASAEHENIRASLAERTARDWNREAMRETIAASQRRRLLVHRATGGEPQYVHCVREGDDSRYVRNTGAAAAKARARFPFVSPARPDSEGGGGKQ